MKITLPPLIFPVTELQSLYSNNDEAKDVKKKCRQTDKPTQYNQYC